MQINLGDKIRQLRKQNAKTQVMLAEALGVTSQAVSRWEANGGYPDIEIIPSIANYFHITIDELFGYDSDRDKRIQKILTDADAYINAQGDMKDCVVMLREALLEFPSETKIMLLLGFALTQFGWKEYGMRSKTTEGCDYPGMDIEFNSQNIYWAEALSLFERVLTMGIGPDDRMAVITVSVNLYSSMGLNDKAKAMAERQDSVMICREVLLASALEGEARDLYQGEALIALIRQLKHVMHMAVLTKLPLVRSEIGAQKLLDVAHLYESILDDGNCGFGHADLRDLYLACAVIYAKLGDMTNAMDYFDIGFDHAKKYEAVRGTGIYHYTAPLVSKVSFPSDNWPVVPAGSWKMWLIAAPENMIESIKLNTKYAECFA